MSEHIHCTCPDCEHTRMAMQPIPPSAPATGWASVPIDSINVIEHLSPNSPPDEDFNSGRKNEIARMQIMDHRAGKPVACAKCKVEYRDIVSLYRCRYCGVWYCAKCADAHFGGPNSVLNNLGSDNANAEPQGGTNHG